MAGGRGKQDLAGQQGEVYPAALRYLARREYGEQELAERLLRRGAEPAVVEETLMRLREQGYLCEARFAASRVRQRRDFNRRGRSAIRAELYSLGVDTAVVEQALQEEFDAEAEKQLLTSLAEAAAAGLIRLPDAQARQRRLQSLQRRWLAHGFPPGDVYEAIRAVAAAVSEEG